MLGVHMPDDLRNAPVQCRGFVPTSSMTPRKASAARLTGFDRLYHAYTLGMIDREELGKR